MLILGISAFYHDSAVALLQDGKILYAAQEERFTRKKHDHTFPKQAIRNCCEYTGISLEDVDHIVFYEKPFLKFDRLFSTYMQFAPRGWRSFIEAMPVWFKEKLYIKHIIQDFTGKGDICFTKHHESHAASAFFPSPFEKAAIITIDGVGEWETLTLGYGEGNRFELEKAIRFPHSLGLLYSAFTYFTGFRVNSGEYKLMGLAPYGNPKYADLIRSRLIDVKEDGSFRLNLDYFNYHLGLTMTSRRFHKLFGAPPRKPETPVRELDMDLAASVQAVLEEIVTRTVRHARNLYNTPNLVMAGGVALNCVANGRILKQGIFDNIWIQPAAGDAGGALGAALYLWHQHLKKPRKAQIQSDSQQGSFLGPEYRTREIKSFLKKKNIEYREYSEQDLPGAIARHIANQKVVGLFQGRMEFGPRALGHRSILGDARSGEMQKIMNLKIKFRESFRPFAPSVLSDKMTDYFDFHHPSNYMLLVYNVNEEKRKNSLQESSSGLEKVNEIRSQVPAITHVDYSARVHSVDPRVNPLYYKVIKSFYEETGCPVIINTSFNVRGEPIVNSPSDAYQCFANTNMDVLVLGNCIIEKKAGNNVGPDSQWLSQFPLD